VPHGVDAKEFSPDRRDERRKAARENLTLSDDEALVLLVGNEPATKGADVAVQAVAGMPDHIKLGIVSHHRTDDRRHLDPGGTLGDRLLMLPVVADPMDYYAASDILLAPSRQDSFNLPVLEALASGLPAIVSSRAGVAELLTDGVDALLLPDPTDIGLASKFIERLLGDSELADALRSAGRRTAERFTWEKNATDTAKLIELEARTPRVLLLAPEARGTGGIQRATRTLAASLSDAYGEDRVGVLSLRAADQPARGRFLWEGVSGEPDRRITFPEKARYLIHAVRTARRWRRRLAIVATHPHLAPVASACSKISGTPFAVWCHGIEAWGKPKPAVARALRSADVVFAPSRFTAERVERMSGLSVDSVRVIPHSVESADGPSGVLRDPRQVLTVARLTRENRYKGIDMLLYAWPRVIGETRARLEVIGDGPDRERLVSVASLLGISEYVTFSGRVSDAALFEAYARATVFAMPARHRLQPSPEGEGFGLVYIEAGRHSLPVVAGLGAGAEDAVEHEGSGLLVDPEDAQQVAAAIVRLLRDPPLAARLGERGRELATTRFSTLLFRDSVDEMIRSMHPRGLID